MTTKPWLAAFGLALALVCPAAANETFGTYIDNLPGAGPVGAADGMYLRQGGVSKRLTVQQLGAVLGVSLPDIELNFATGTYTGGCSLAGCTSTSNGGGYAQWVDGHWSLFGANTPRVTDKGLLREPAATNLALYSRDLSQAAWTKSNLTSAATTGVDNVANSASALTATGANGTACQSITNSGGSFGEFTYTVFLKRASGTGEVDLSLEPAPGHSGTVWYPITQTGQVPALSSSWQRFQLTFAGMANPTFCVRVVSSGDVVDADFAQVENKTWATSPILTTSSAATRAADIISITGLAVTLLNSGAGTLIATESGVNAGAFRHQSGNGGSPPLIGGSALDLYSWQYAANAVFANYGSTEAGTTPFAICGPTSTIDGDQSLALPVVYGMTWSAATFFMDCDGSATFAGPGSPPSNQTWYFGDGSTAATSIVSDLKLFNATFSILALQNATAFSNKFQITDASPPGGEWNGYNSNSGSIAVGGVNPPGGGGVQYTYAFESGLLSSGITAPIQIGPVGNYLRFNLFANNCWVEDDCQIGGTGGSQRSELDGDGSAQWTNGQEVWVAYSDCVEPGPPITSNWFITGQVHQSINPAGGSSPTVLITGGIGEYRSIVFVTDANQSYTTGYQWPIVRGKWENMVIDMIMDPTGATGKFKVWRNGTLVVNYTGVTGQTPVSGTQQYYWKFGQYESQVPEYQATRYANMTVSIIANGDPSLTGKVASPDAIPSGYGTTCQ